LTKLLPKVWWLPFLGHGVEVWHSCSGWLLENRNDSFIEPRHGRLVSDHTRHKFTYHAGYYCILIVMHGMH